MKILIKFFFVFLIFQYSAKAENLFKTLASTYIDNKELNSQREKTKAVDETLIQSYSIFKPTITGTVTKNDYLNEAQKNSSGTSINDSNLQTEKKSIKVEQKILQGIPQALATKAEVNIARQELKSIEQKVLLKAVDAYTSVLASKKKLLFHFLV